MKRDGDPKRKKEKIKGFNYSSKVALTRMDDSPVEALAGRFRNWTNEYVDTLRQTIREIVEIVCSVALKIKCGSNPLKRLRDRSKSLDVYSGNQDFVGKYQSFDSEHVQECLYVHVTHVHKHGVSS